MAEGVGVTAFITRPLTRGKLMARVEAALAQTPESRWPATLEEAGDKLENRGRTAGALSVYKAALDIGRRRLAGIHTEMGLGYLSRDKIEEALTSLEQAALLDPSLSRAQFHLGRAYLQTGRPAEAGRAFERALVLDPQNETVQQLLVDALNRSEQFQRADTYTFKFLETKPDNLYLINQRGIALRKLGKYNEAIDVYRRAISLSRDDENLFFNLGRSLFDLGDYKRAAIAVKRALSLNPEFPEAAGLMEKIKIMMDGKPK